MSEAPTVGLQPTDLVIHRLLPQGECHWSGKSGEAVEISSVAAGIEHGVISLKELPRLLRFLHRQGDKHQGNGKAEATP